MRNAGFRRVVRPDRTGSSSGQSIVETALTLVIYAIIVFAVIDLGRAIYYNNLASRVSDAAALDMTLPDSRATDCYAWEDGLTAGNGIAISLDSHSVYNSGGAQLAKSIPALGQGLLYLYPAVANTYPGAGIPTSGALGTCYLDGAATTGVTRAASTASNPVTATVTICFQPWTPFIGSILGLATAHTGCPLGGLPITSVSSLQTEYSH